MPFSGTSPKSNPNSRGGRQFFASDVRKGEGRQDVRPDNRGAPRSKYFPGSSAKVPTDTEPENQKQVDLRKVDPDTTRRIDPKVAGNEGATVRAPMDARDTIARSNAREEGRGRSLRAARAAERYRRSAATRPPLIRGRVTRGQEDAITNRAFLGDLNEIPTLGASYQPEGSYTKSARKGEGPRGPSRGFSFGGFGNFIP